MKKFLSVLLAICLLAACLPLSAGAASPAADIKTKMYQLVNASPYKGASYTAFNGKGWGSGCYATIYSLSRDLFGVGIPSQAKNSYGYYTNLASNSSWTQVGSTLGNNDAVKALLQKGQAGDVVEVVSDQLAAKSSLHIFMLYDTDSKYISYFDSSKSTGARLHTETWASFFNYGAYNIGTFNNAGTGLTVVRCNKNLVNPPVSTPHTTHTKGVFQYFGKSHPHYNYYKCAVCGEIFMDSSTHGYYELCSTCNTPVMPTNLQINLDKTSYNPGDTVKITVTASNATWYRIEVWDGGAYHVGNKVYSDGNNNGSFSYQVQNGGMFNVRADAVNTNGTISADKGFAVPTAPTSSVVMPGKPILKNISSIYSTSSGTPKIITYSWDATANTTHYNAWTWVQDSSGNWRYCSRTDFATSGMTISLSAGKYKAQIFSYNSNHWMPDGSDWLHTDGEPVYFTVQEEPSPDSENPQDSPAEPDPDPTPENSFIDVPNGAYFAEAVNWAVDKGITAGTSSNTFSPNAICTRAQAVTFLWRAAGSPEPSGSSTKFVDVANGQYYTKAVQWAVEKGITGGTSATTFSPNDKCTRAQIVTFLYRLENSPSVSGVSPFADVPPTLYYANAVAWAVENGITSGTSASTFSPHNDCSRGQIVTFLYRDANK